MCVCWRGGGGALHCGYKTLSDEWAERQQFALRGEGGGGLASRSMMPRFPHLRLNVTPIGLLHCRSWRGQRPCGVVLKEKSVSFGVCVSQTGS